MVCLDESSLNAARLACRAFRTASLPFITTLYIDTTFQCNADIGRELARCTSSLPFLQHLKLCFDLPHNAPLFEQAAECSALCELHLVVSCGYDFGKRPEQLLEPLCPILQRATGVTSLSLDLMPYISPRAGMLLGSAFQACSSLVELRISEGCFFTMSPDEALGSLPSLQELHWDSYWWPEVLWSVKSLKTRLRRLCGFVMEEDGDVELLAPLTQLTHLRVLCGWPTDTTRLSMLSMLSSLRGLVLDSREHELDPTELLALVAPLTHLTELQAPCWAPAINGSWASLFASLPAIRRIRLTGYVWRHLECCKCLWEGHPYTRYNWCPCCRPESCIKAIEVAQGAGCSTWDPEPLVRPWRALTGLQLLEMQCCYNDCVQLLAQLPGLPFLTSLCVHVLDGRPAEAPALSASFLTGLPQLTTLGLSHVLDVEHWEDDVSYIVALTEPRRLILDVRLWGGHLSSAQLQPLMAIKQLQYLKVSGHLRPVVGAPEFPGDLQGVRHRIGLLPTIICCCELG
eukprot:jgi/Botrbrau1/17790/Bobra.0127s0041.1